MNCIVISFDRSFAGLSGNRICSVLSEIAGRFSALFAVRQCGTRVRSVWLYVRTITHTPPNTNRTVVHTDERSTSMHVCIYESVYTFCGHAVEGLAVM